MRYCIRSLLLITALCGACAAQHPGPLITELGVRFTFLAPEAKNVSLAGSFNHWDPHQYVLSGPDRRGNWSTTIPLPPGRHEYLFIINETIWKPDPAALAVDDGMGGKNSYIEITR